MRADRENDLVLRHLGVLELKPGATLADVKEAYRDLARVWHPDRFTDERLAAKAQNRLKEINSAYAWIKKNPAALARAHAPVARPRPRPASPPQPPPPPPPPPQPEPQATRPESEEVKPEPPPTAKEMPVEEPPPVALQLTLVLAAGTACMALGLTLATFHFSPAPPPQPTPRAAIAPVQERSEAAGSGWSEDAEAEGREAFDEWFGHLAAVDEWFGRFARTPSPTSSGRLLQARREPPPTPPARPAAEPGSFTVGSSRDEVLSAQGVPTQVSENAWWYGLSKVFFEDGRVVGWFAFRSDPLNARMWIPQDTRSPGYFTLGSTPNEVLAAQGTPSGLSERVWYYGRSRIYFDEGRVVNWVSARDEPLAVRMFPSVPVESKGYFTRGSTKDEVLAAQGTPTEFTADEWRYGLSIVQFHEGRVVDWQSSRANPLHTVRKDQGLRKDEG